MNQAPNHRILFLGAGFRTTMAQLFHREILKFEHGFDFYSVEFPSQILPPIADYMPVIPGPKFDSIDFQSFLDAETAKVGKVLFIPFMDSAARALAAWGRVHMDPESFFGSADAEKISDKVFLRDRLPSIGLASPSFTGLSQYVIVKPKLGFGSRGLEKMTLDLFQKRESEWDNNWLVQDFIEGNEVSLDVYVDRFGNSSSIARDRIRVSEGEVLETETRDLDSYEKKIVDALISEFELRGPINVQLIGDEKLVLEINPRFSGGSTASISAGWNAPNWLVSEYLFGREARLDANYRHVHVIRSRRDHLRRVE